MSTGQPIKFVVGPEVVGSYRRLSYSPWHAIAEFVDNSTQSFYDNEQALRGLHVGSRPPLRVTIDYSPGKGILVVWDNAMGMSRTDLKRALHLANPPQNPTGRSKYGLGLKTAACWLGNKWTIVTKKLRSSKEFTVSVDVEQITQGDASLDESVRDGQPKESHYTRITIEDMNRSFKGRTLARIAQHLRSMYRQDYRDKVLDLRWRGATLKWKEIDENLLRDADDNAYKKDFKFRVKGKKGDASKLVHGWVGILEHGSRSSAGFSILHANRVVKGWPDSWRPESLYGDYQGRNDLVNQRLVGEIHLDDFDVSHTKDDILWLGDEEEKVEAELAKWCGDFKTIAQEYRKGVSDERGPDDSQTNTAISNLVAELGSHEIRDIVHTVTSVSKKLTKSVVNGVLKQVTGSGMATIECHLNGLAVKVFVQSDMSVNDPYLTVDSAVEDKVIIVVNREHPHWAQLDGSRGVLNYLRHCVYDGIAEWQAKKQASTINPSTIKIYKDRYLRLALSIEGGTND